jgi:HlyD family secretion protein
MQGDRQRPTWNIRRPLILGVATVVALLTFFGTWAALAHIAGAVIGSGVIEVSTTRTVVQHPIGGVVVEILKRDGDRVEAGEVVLRLDDRDLRSALKVTEGALFETLANIDRLEAALEDQRQMTLHPLLDAAAAANPEVQALLARLQRQLDDHFTTIDTEMRLLDEQITQTEAQIAGVEAQLEAKEDEQAILATELARARQLSTRGLIVATELTTLEKSDAAVRGEIGRLKAQIAELQGRSTEIGLKRLSVVPDSAELIGVELSRLRPERTRLLEARRGILEDLSRLEIRVPVSGKIIDSQVFGLRSVVVAASPLMMIVPQDEPVLARIRVSATDIDQIYVGQEASLKFTAFNGRQIPIILGNVRQVSADAFRDQLTQKSYYNVAVALEETELAKLGHKDLIPGMPVEAFLATESRSPLNYLLRPIVFYFNRSFRDA